MKKKNDYVQDIVKLFFHPEGKVPDNIADRDKAIAEILDEYADSKNKD